MRLYAFGSNGSGQLGIGSLEDTSSPQLCQFDAETRRIQPTGIPAKIAAGGNATYVLFNNGDLYRAGRASISSANQQPSSSSTFQKLCSREYSRTRLCSSIWDGAVFANADNEIWVEGSGPAGELGLGKEIKHCAEAEKLEGFPPLGLEIVDIASCVSQTVVALSNGDAWGWGNGRKGQLGEPAGVVWKPRKITDIEFPIIRVACGREFTLLVGEASNGKFAVLGSDKYGIKTRAPKDIREWKDIGASWGSIFVLNNDGLFISWGRNDRGQLAPPNLPIIKKLAVGSEHVLALSQEGSVHAWGWGEHGNCGSPTDGQGNVKNGDWNSFPVDHQQTSEVIFGIGAGCATSFIWSS